MHSPFHLLGDALCDIARECSTEEYGLDMRYDACADEAFMELCAIIQDEDILDGAMPIEYCIALFRHSLENSGWIVGANELETAILNPIIECTVCHEQKNRLHMTFDWYQNDAAVCYNCAANSGRFSGVARRV